MTGEILLFARALWYGAALLAVYDCLRVLRRTVRHRGWAVAVEDLFYWIGAGFFIFAGLYRQNSGILRGYFFAGMALGMVLYFWGISPFFVRYASVLLKWFKEILKIPEKAGKKAIKRLKSAAARVKLSISRSICRKAPARGDKDGKNEKKSRTVRKRKSRKQQSAE